MFRLGKKYRHFVHDTSCGCTNPLLQQRFRGSSSAPQFVYPVCRQTGRHRERSARWYPGLGREYEVRIHV